MWRSLNQILSRKGNRPVPADPEEMKDIFSSVFEDSPTCDLISCAHSSLLSISLKDVIITLRSLRKGSPGPDGLPFWVFRDYCDFLAPAIHHICGLSFTTGVVPNVLKRSNTEMRQTNALRLQTYISPADSIQGFGENRPEKNGSNLSFPNSAIANSLLFQGRVKEV